jgi:hypothetical protein
MLARRAIWMLIATAMLLPAARGADPPSPSEEEDAKSARIDEATDRALAYLARTQRSDGSWASQYGGANAAVCSLAITAFLAKGHTPGDGPYGEKITKGIEHILSCQRPNGLIVARPSHGPMYSHCISTLMLAEAVGMLDGPIQRRARRGLAKAVKLTLEAQALAKGGRYKGGWRYQPNSRDADISVTGWALLSLRAAKNAGARVPDEAFRKGIAYIKGLACRGGGFGYSGPSGPSIARAGTGILCLEICGRHHAPEAKLAGDYLLKQRLRFGGNHFYYGVYYASQAMFQLGDKYWMAYKPQIERVLLERQKADGSWPPESGSGRAGGPVYFTAMSVLALSVQYRYLPIYQR